MVTLTAELPVTFSRTLRPSRANRSLDRCRPIRPPQRTRRDVLHMLAGADSGQSPRFPKRRFIR